jgi:DNA adenine methylase
MTLEPVNSVKPVAPYIGGKRALSKTLVDQIAAVDHELYAEPFVGMGGVFFRRKHRPRAEVINDISKDVVLLFRWLQRDYQQVLDMLKWQICSHEDFDRLLATDVATLTELERVARFLFLQRTSFGGQVAKRNFGLSRSTPARFDLTKLVPMLEDVHERLSSVVIENLQYKTFINRYDAEKTLYYIDPPYFGSEGDYGPGVFARADFANLADLLSRIKGRFIMSLNDRPETRAIFAAFHIESVTLNYRISGKVMPAKEIIISNI